MDGKRIFTTLQEKSESANILLSLREQELFCSVNKAIYPVPNKWGTNGWTTFEITKLERHVIPDALNSAYQDVLKTGKRK